MKAVTFGDIVTWNLVQAMAKESEKNVTDLDGKMVDIFDLDAEGEEKFAVYTMGANDDQSYIGLRLIDEDQRAHVFLYFNDVSRYVRSENPEEAQFKV